MKKIEIEYIYADGVNSFAEGSRFDGGNGGNYPQGVMTIIFNDGTMFCIVDDSCGDYGTRVQGVLITRGAESVYREQHGTMLDEELWYSEILDMYVTYLKVIYNTLGYHFRTETEMDEYLHD